MTYRSKVFNNRYKTRKLINLAKTKRYSASRLAKIFSCNKKTVFKVLQVNGIILPNLGRFKKRIYCLKDFFSNLSALSSYWLGFIAADGTLWNRDKSISIGLNRRDAGHLYKFKRAIKTNARLGYVKSNDSAHISICCRPMYESLIQLGIMPNKSLNINHVRLPTYLMRHFIRGVFDGDGWISGKKVTHVQFGIAGNRPFLRHIQSILIKKCHVNRVKLYQLSGEAGAYKLQYTGSQIFKILDFLYNNSDSQMRLTRKYQKTLELRKQFKIDDKKHRWS